jgi:hypothetical protein
MLALLAQESPPAEDLPIEGPWLYTVVAVAILGILVIAWKLWQSRRDSQSTLAPSEMAVLSALRDQGREYKTPSGTLIIAAPDDDLIDEEDRQAVARVQDDEPEPESWETLDQNTQKGMLDALSDTIAARRSEVESESKQGQVGPGDAVVIQIRCPQCGAGIDTTATNQDHIVCPSCGFAMPFKVIRVPPK